MMELSDVLANATNNTINPISHDSDINFANNIRFVYLGEKDTNTLSMLTLNYLIP